MKQVLAVVLCLLISSWTFAADDLAAGFSSPPHEARLRAYWWWLNGNVTKASITKDMEWMKKIGMGGALVFDAGGANQGGHAPVPAGPLYGTPQWIELFKHAASEADRLGLQLTVSPQSGWNLGGPCITPELSTKHITFSETQVKGPVKFSAALPAPVKVNNFYRDSFVLAYRIKDPPPGAKRRPIRQLEAKSARHELGGSATDCTPLLFDIDPIHGEEDVLVKNVVDLTDKLHKGVLQWDVPKGTWQVVRFGYTNAGGRVSTSSGKWTGLVVDYMDPAAVKTYWKQVVDPILDAIGSLAGKSVVGFETDSWEGGGMNWTAKMPEEFAKRRGYDIRPWLLVVAGKIVDSRDASNRFLADLRKTVGDCMADNHYGIMAELARQRGMFIHCEASGPHAGPFDGQKNLGRCEWPMAEFWVRSPHRPSEETRFFMKMAACAAHTYGKKIACGEGFTSIGPQWNDVLWSSQKPTFDHEACAGLNLVFWHAFTCSPDEMGLPGQEYFAGTHFNPQVTWANQAHAFVGYLDRCQYLLQQGLFVADVCVYSGDHVPNIVPRKQADPAKILPGYDYDVFSEEVLLTRMSVKDGRIVLPDGMSYRVMVLPELRIMSLPAIRKVRDLVKDGATVIGPKPLRTASLTEYPTSDVEMKKIADELWDASRVISGKNAKEVLASLGVAPDFEAPADSNLDYIHRRDGETEIYFISNPKPDGVKASCTFRVSGKQPEIWDAVSGTIRDAAAFQQNSGRTIVPLEFGPYGSIFVVFRKSTNAATGSGKNFPSFRPVAELTGPWIVSFNEKWGGPRSIQFDQLLDWTLRPEAGIKYYSGTATYRKTFTNPKAAGRVFIDLGLVWNLAEVRLNDKSLGVTWCPPFRLDITDALRDGENKLEIDVINTWYNRLVGDLALPPAKRMTKTNIRLKPNSKPAPSGLLGPVTIQVREE